MISVTYVDLLVFLYLFVIICLFVIDKTIAPYKKYSLKYFYTDDDNLQNGRYIEIIEIIDGFTLPLYIRNKNKLRNIDNMKYILIDIKEIKGGNDEQQKK